MAECELIVYACPTGELADQIQIYMARSQQEIGANAAHRYRPHCTLTGFFHDQATALPRYLEALENSYRSEQESQPHPVFQISEILYRPDFHGLILESDWIKAMIQTFAEQADSSTRVDCLRLKQWLHLSLAYGFATDHHEPLIGLAEEIISIQSPVGWDLRFYQRHPDGDWTCHRSWTLDP